MATRRLGLDDPTVVEIRKDRGESEYVKSKPTKASGPHPEISSHQQCDRKTGKVKLKSIIKTIRCELERTRVRYPRNAHSNYFIPRNQLQNIANPGRIREVIDHLSVCKKLGDHGRESLCETICSDDQSDKRCWKLLLVLLLIGKHEQLLQLIEEGVSDQCLPLRVDVPECRVPGHEHRTIEAWSDNDRCEASKLSYAFNAPYFTRVGGKHSHYILEPSDVLPVSRTVERGPSPDAPTSHQRQEGDQRAISGGFSEVVIVVLDQSHYDFPDIGSWNHQRGPRQFALKKLHSMDRETFNAELASLLRVQGRGSKHLIEVLITYEVRGDQGTTYHLLFPCAQGDLWTFWKKHQEEHERIPRGLWMAQQIHHIAKALLIFHNEREHHLELAGPLNGLENGRNRRIDLYGRHGDIKADNILWFEEDDRLVITDFGLGRLNSKYSRSGVDPKSVERTATYKAPEFDLFRGSISRVSDIFSLGCMYLEFVTWFLEGWEAVNDKFVECRMEKDLQNFTLDTFFKIEDRGDNEEERAIIKPQVREWIQRLRKSKHSSCYTLQLLEFIEDKMLEPDASRRIKSGAVVHELEKLARTCCHIPASCNNRPQASKDCCRSRLAIGVF